MSVLICNQVLLKEISESIFSHDCIVRCKSALADSIGNFNVNLKTSDFFCMENVLSLQNSHQSILQGLSNVVNITFQIDRLLGQLPAIHWTKPVREIAIKLMNVCQSTIIDGLHRLIKLKTIFPLFQVSALSRRNNSLNLYTVVHRRYILPNLPLKTCYLLPIAMVVTITNFFDRQNGADFKTFCCNFVCHVS